MSKFNGKLTAQEITWNKCVEEGKVLVKLNTETRLKIVALVEKCCVITRGGRSFETKFTIKNFAESIGMNPKTLNEWVRLKQNVMDNLPEEERKSVKTTDLQLIDRQLKGVSRNSKLYKSEVKRVAKEVMTLNATTRKMMKYVKHMQTVLYNVKHKPLIDDCRRDVLVEMLHISREINKHLSWVDYEVKPKTILKKAEITT